MRKCNSPLPSQHLKSNKLNEIELRLGAPNSYATMLFRCRVAWSLCTWFDGMSNFHRFSHRWTRCQSISSHSMRLPIDTRSIFADGEPTWMDMQAVTISFALLSRVKYRFRPKLAISHSKIDSHVCASIHRDWICILKNFLTIFVNYSLI